MISEPTLVHGEMVEELVEELGLTLEELVVSLGAILSLYPDLINRTLSLRKIVARSS